MALLQESFNEMNYYHEDVQYDGFDDFVETGSHAACLAILGSHAYKNSNNKKTLAIYERDVRSLDLTERIIEETELLLKKRSCQSCKVVKNEYTDIVCVTISPNPLLSNKRDNLHKLLKNKSFYKECKSIYGIFELSTGNENYHTHYLIHFKDKNQLQNLYKKVRAINDRSGTTFIISTDSIKNKVHLVKCIRYMEKKTKKFVEYFERPGSRDYFYGLTDYTDPLPEWFENKKIEL